MRKRISELLLACLSDHSSQRIFEEEQKERKREKKEEILTFGLRLSSVDFSSLSSTSIALLHTDTHQLTNMISAPLKKYKRRRDCEDQFLP